ncbi:uncharacterized protein LOC132296473 [Cornus florida]|uniref:uncharacterized protein LOC132296473 n=1 Tax=Cornus florida TaxID=4283 RepID=UPI0028A248C4|nr:uncharacterized protein LOC132296473 [Cornus florida]
MWISSIVPVKKKNGQIRVCVDFRDLNSACPKDDFPLPVVELTKDATMGHEALSFTDCFSGYNQIRMAPKDEELTVFHTPKGIYCYKVMPLRLKNAADPLKYVMSRPVLSGRLARWSILFNEFEILYVPRKAVRGQALADFLADHPIPTDWEIFEDFPDEKVFFIDVLLPWMMFFDGAARSDEAGAGMVFVSP